MSEAFETAAKIILVLAGLVVLIFFMQKTMFAGDKLIDERVCRESIKTHSLLVRSGVDQAPDIECSPRETEIKNGDLERALAEEMLFCWQRWESGNIDLFVDEGTYCNVCSTLTLEENVNLAEVFMLEKSGSRYGDLLLPYESMQNPSKLVQQPPVPAGKTAVIFYYDKGHSTKSIWDALSEDPLAVSKAVEEIGATGVVGGAVGGGAGALIGGVCAYFTVGWCAASIPYLAAKGFVIGAFVGGGSGVLYQYNEGIAHPEWISSIFVIPHEAYYYETLGCEFTAQQGARDRVGTAENI